MLLERDPGAVPLQQADAGDLDDEMLAEVWRRVRALHAARIAHRQMHLGDVPACVTCGAPTPSRSYYHP